LAASSTAPQRTAKFEPLSLAFSVVWQQRQLVQPFLELRGSFCHRRAGGGFVAGLAPIDDGFFDEPGLGVMLREELGLAVHPLWRLGFERFGDPRVQLLTRPAQQAAMRRVLHQRVLEAVNRIGRNAAMECQLGGDEAGKRGLQLVLGKTRNRAQHRVGKLASYRRADLCHQPYRRQAV
jgi:hypothetical protein